MRLLLGTASRKENTKCFFCGKEFSFEKGDHICSVRFDDQEVDEQFGQHACSSCAGLGDDELEDRFEGRVSDHRDRAEDLRQEAQELEEKADRLEEVSTRDIQRVWHHSAMADS